MLYVVLYKYNRWGVCYGTPELLLEKMVILKFVKKVGLVFKSCFYDPWDSESLDTRD